MRSIEPVTVAARLLDVLREHGIDTVFGIPGGAVSAMYAALMDRPDVRVVNAKHETGAVFMAMGYAMARDRPGAVLTTAGPGVTNALTGLASALYEGVPLVHIAGEVPRGSFGRGALQEGSAHEIDVVGMARRTTKLSVEITRASSATTLLRKALATALAPRRGPTFLSLPLDVANERCGEQVHVDGRRATFDVDVAACGKVAALLAGAERPLVIAGSGARSAASRSALAELAERFGVPVAVTTKGKGVFAEDHPRYLGVLGFGGHDSVVEYLGRGVDVLLVLGSGLNDFATNAWSPLVKADRAFVQVDVDPGRIGRSYPVDIGIVGPMESVIARMLESEAAPEAPARPPTRAFGPHTQPCEPSPSGALTTAEVVLALDDACPRDSIFTADMGEHLAFALHYLRVRKGGDFITCLGFGSMGSGICTAIGLGLGAPSRRTFAICGDGGFLMYGAELTTAVQLGVGTTFVIINDSRFNMVHHGMRDLYGRTPDFALPTVDFAAAARAAGAEGIVVRTREELDTAVRAPRHGPLVLDVRVDPDSRLGGSQRNAALRQFKEESS